jgi:hypothetical protein
MINQWILRVCTVLSVVIVPIYAFATPFIDVEGRIDEVEAQRTSSLLGKPGLYWFRMSDESRWLFIPPDTYAGVAAAAAVSTMNTLGTEFFWRVPGGANVGSVYFTIHADLKDPQGSGLTRDYNKLRSVTLNHTENPDQFGTAGMSYVSYVSVSLESNRAYATISVAGSTQQDFIELSTPAQVATAVFALSRKKPVTYGKSCAYIYNLQTNRLDTVCDSAAWLNAG